MEDQIRSNALENRQAVWIVNPIFDLFLLANIAWPLLLLPGFSTDNDTVVDFWQIYFLTLPHRWLTLFLVVVDPDRRQHKTGLMIAVALLLAVAVLASYWGFDWGTRAFICLGFVDYVWNGWHFASQHAGVLRIYSRKVGDGWPWLERWGLRAFIFGTILRTSSALLWPQGVLAIEQLLPYLDGALLTVPAMLIAVCVIRFKWAQLSKLVYISSISALYSLYLLASHYHLPKLILCLATAAALFHAVEYLAIVTYYAQRRQASGSLGLMRWFSQRWAITLASFVLTLGMLGVYLSGNHGELGTVWQGLNLWAALVHYSLDGMIWKLRQPATAHSLGVA